MDELKEAFLRVRNDINFLFNELNSIKDDLEQTKISLVEMKDSLNMLKGLIFQQTNRQTDKQTKEEVPTREPFYSTEGTHNSTYNLTIKALKPENLGVSTGNDGVPTDKQTNRQTDKQTENSSHNTKDSFESALRVLDSLDVLKKELRIKFKRLTDQEMAVFSVLYQLSEEQGYSDYKSLSVRLNLSESSIRDYIGKIIFKGIPIEKTKINNKNIQLSISKNLKKIASLQTISQLREI